MARRTLSQTERELKQNFDEAIKQYSVDCLKQVYKIATNATDMSVRLKACTYILDRYCGRNYRILEEEQEEPQQNQMDIKLTITKSKEINTEQIEEEIRTVECESLGDDLEEWNNDDNWGESDIYYPSK